MNAAVFISHSSKDRKTALTICGALEHRGVRCWIASRDVRPGTNFEESIVQAIRLARVMVLVFTANANNSDEMKKEIVLAGQHRLVVIPVRAEDVVPNDAFSYEFATRQWIDLFEDWENAIEGLVSQIEFTLGEHPAPQERDVSRSMSRSTFAAPHARNWPVIIGIVASAVLLIAAGIGARYHFSAPTAVVSTASVQTVAPANQLTGTIVGSISPDGTILTAPSSGSLTTAAGVWTFGTAQPSGAPGQYQILLNGNANSWPAGQGYAAKMEVAHGGTLYPYNSLANRWWVWNGGGWLGSAAP
jgi:hypothetical protein